VLHVALCFLLEICDMSRIKHHMHPKCVSWWLNLWGGGTSPLLIAPQQKNNQEKSKQWTSNVTDVYGCLWYYNYNYIYMNIYIYNYIELARWMGLGHRRRSTWTSWWPTSGWVWSVAPRSSIWSPSWTTGTPPGLSEKGTARFVGYHRWYPLVI